MNNPIPLLILSDAPTSGTGLGRITHDLAIRIHQHLSDVFRVGTAGYGGPYSRSLGFPQYSLDIQEWVVFNLPDIWCDFAGEEKGILFSIWDASRLLWLARPENCADGRLRKFLTPRPFSLWGYFPIDATGPKDRLTLQLEHIIRGYDRVLTYSRWAEDIIRRTLDVEGAVHEDSCSKNVTTICNCGARVPLARTLTNLPHGIDTSVFYPRNRTAARHGLGERIGARSSKGKPLSVPDDALMIGIVATNQVRKDWGLGIATVAEIAKERNYFLWVQTDVLERHWSIPSLLYDFGLRERDKNLMMVHPLTDDNMAWMYSACDVTLGIGNGEGFGYPIFESLACGVPCVHGNYGGAAEHLPSWMLADPIASRLEGAYCCVRNDYSATEWAGIAVGLAESRPPDHLPEHLDWLNLWPRWAEWLKEGVQ